jgi:hypothetical protein
MPPFDLHPNPKSPSPEAASPDSPQPAPCPTPDSASLSSRSVRSSAAALPPTNIPEPAKSSTTASTFSSALCTNLIEFYERIGVADQIRWYDQMNFIEPGGRISTMKSSPLPAPLHTAPSFWKFSFLSAADKFAIARALIPFTLTDAARHRTILPTLARSTRSNQNGSRALLAPHSGQRVQRRTRPISISAAAQVVRESMKSPAARQMGVPTVPLTDLYNAAGDYIRARGGILHFRRPVESFHPRRFTSAVRLRGLKETITKRIRRNPSTISILALPFDALDRILPEASRERSHPRATHPL